MQKRSYQQAFQDTKGLFFANQFLSLQTVLSIAAPQLNATATQSTARSGAVPVPPAPRPQILPCRRHALMPRRLSRSPTRSMGIRVFGMLDMLTRGLLRCTRKKPKTERKEKRSDTDRILGSTNTENPYCMTLQYQDMPGYSVFGCTNTANMTMPIYYNIATPTTSPNMTIASSEPTATGKTDSDDDADKSDGPNGAVIGGIVAGVAVGLLIIIAALCLRRKPRRHRPAQTSSSKGSVMAHSGGYQRAPQTPGGGSDAPGLPGMFQYRLPNFSADTGMSMGPKASPSRPYSMSSYGLYDSSLPDFHHENLSPRSQSPVSPGSLSVYSRRRPESSMAPAPPRLSISEIAAGPPGSPTYFARPTSNSRPVSPYGRPVSPYGRPTSRPTSRPPSRPGSRPVSPYGRPRSRPISPHGRPISGSPMRPNSRPHPGSPSRPLSWPNPGSPSRPTSRPTSRPPSRGPPSRPTSRPPSRPPSRPGSTPTPVVTTELKEPSTKNTA